MNIFKSTCLFLSDQFNPDQHCYWDSLNGIHNNDCNGFAASSCDPVTYISCAFRKEISSTKEYLCMTDAPFNSVHKDHIMRPVDQLMDNEIKIHKQCRLSTDVDCNLCLSLTDAQYIWASIGIYRHRNRLIWSSSGVPHHFVYRSQQHEWVCIINRF